jgi:DNA-binding NtrC family response regulator
MERRTAILGAFLGDSKSIEQVRLRASLLAVESGSVLVWGEPGTGKRLLARLMHRAGRPGRPYIARRTAELAEDELPVLFDDAGNGTLVLEEVERARPALQRALAECLRERVAGVVPLQARILATCSADPFAFCERGVLDTALYQAVSGSVLALPALRERPGDRRLLAEHLLRRERGVGYDEIVLAPDALDVMETLELRGNAAELQCLVTRIGVLRRRGVVTGEHVLAALSLEGEGGWRRARAEAMREFTRSYLGALLAEQLSTEIPDDLPARLKEFVRLWRDGAREIQIVDEASRAVDAWLDGIVIDRPTDLSDAALVFVRHSGPRENDA